jgi:hypothetical protein
MMTDLLTNLRAGKNAMSDSSSDIYSMKYLCYCCLAKTSNINEKIKN